jgi:hypothetical protein
MQSCQGSSVGNEPWCSLEEVIMEVEKEEEVNDDMANF